jgi:predicted site-specific integrase-resolvase
VKKWAYAGKIKYIKTPGGKYSEIKRLLGEAPKGKEKTRGGSQECR